MLKNILTRSKDMRLNIVGVKKENGKIVPDMDKFIADVVMDQKNEKVILDIHDQKYETHLRKIFSEPFHHFLAGASTSQGSLDGGLQVIQPWDPDFLDVLSNKLLGLGLRYVIVGEK
jgi:hypothetical protein